MSVATSWLAVHEPPANVMAFKDTSLKRPHASTALSPPDASDVPTALAVPGTSAGAVHAPACDRAQWSSDCPVSGPVACCQTARTPPAPSPDSRGADSEGGYTPGSPRAMYTG